MEKEDLLIIGLPILAVGIGVYVYVNNKNKVAAKAASDAANAAAAADEKAKQAALIPAIDQIITTGLTNVVTPAIAATTDNSEKQRINQIATDFKHLKDTVDANLMSSDELQSIKDYLMSSAEFGNHSYVGTKTSNQLNNDFVNVTTKYNCQILGMSLVNLAATATAAFSGFKNI